MFLALQATEYNNDNKLMVDFCTKGWYTRYVIIQSWFEGEELKDYTPDVAVEDPHVLLYRKQVEQRRVAKIDKEIMNLVYKIGIDKVKEEVMSSHNPVLKSDGVPCDECEDGANPGMITVLDSQNSDPPRYIDLCWRHAMQLGYNRPLRKFYPEGRLPTED